jgi:peptide-methionine (S)-S-oxide reductase
MTGVKPYEVISMPRFSWRILALLFVVLAFGFVAARRSTPRTLTVPSAPAAETATGSQVAVLAGGCFWGIEAVYERIRGVSEVVSGFAGGTAANADYGTVSTGRTGHAESVRITYDPEQVSYGTLLEVFFSVAHDPTQRDRQGPDVGSQYRSEIFFTTDEQAKIARDYIAKVEKSGVWSRPIVTKIEKLDGFYPAEAYHQDYFEHHPNSAYIMINDRPKVEALKKQFPDLYRERTTT